MYLMHTLQVKRIYDVFSDKDGIRILVDRLWPRGVSKENAHLDDWLKDIAPSTELREWFNHEPEKFNEFSTSYIKELRNNEEVAKVRKLLKHHNVTLLYAAKNPYINHAIVLQKFILGKD